MPSKIYCPNVNCAEPILYELTTPVVCPFCGTNLNNKTSFASQKPQPKPIKKQAIEEINEDFDDLDDGESLPENEEAPKLHRLFGQTSKKSKKNRKRREIDEDSDDIDIDNLNINALQLDIPISTKKDKGVKFEEIAFQKKTGYVREKPKKINKKKELDAFYEEAGRGGRKDISIEDKGAE